MVDFIDKKVGTNRPLATTKIRHDSCAAYDGLVVLLHEAKSGPDSQEMLKLTMGLCRMLPYEKEAMGWLSDSKFVTWVKAEIDDTLGEISVKRCPELYNDVNDKNGDRRAQRVLNIIKRLGAILASKEHSLDKYLQVTAGSRDNPQKKTKLTVDTLDVQEGIFCAEEQAKAAVNVDEFGNEVLQKGWNDFHGKKAAYSQKGTR